MPGKVGGTGLARRVDSREGAVREMGKEAGRSGGKDGGKRQIRGRVRRQDRRGGRAPGASQPVCPGVLMQAWYTEREEQEG